MPLMFRYKAQSQPNSIQIKSQKLRTRSEEQIALEVLSIVSRLNEDDDPSKNAKYHHLKNDDTFLDRRIVTSVEKTFLGN